MSVKVDLYDNAYGNYQEQVYALVRTETYGEDLGQTSWVTSEESYEIPQILHLAPESQVFEIGCGSGRYALHLSEKYACRIVGVDSNVSAIRAANQLATARALSQVRFDHGDASKRLQLADASFDAVFANDVLCHIPERFQLLKEVFRILKPGGMLLFSDALVIGGLISQQEIAIRSSIGYYLFSPPGKNEALMRRSGFRLIKRRDTTENAAVIAQRWHRAREKRQQLLSSFEGNSNFQGLQQFLSCVYTLSSERRLLRYLYTAQK